MRRKMARNKAVYSVPGIDPVGHKDVLGLWMSESKCANFWSMIFDELKAWGVEQKLFVCIDVLSELEQGTLIIFPQAHVQHCMVHLVRGSLEYIPTKHYKDFYNAPRTATQY